MKYLISLPLLLPAQTWCQELNTLTSNDYLSYALIAIITLLSSFLGAYLKTKGHNIATKEDLSALKSSLSETTTLVEDIKAEFVDKSWVKQQTYPIKSEVLFSIKEILYKYNELYQKLFIEESDYHYIYYENFGFSLGGTDVPYDAPIEIQNEAEQYDKQYWEYANKRINLEKKKHTFTYGSSEYKENINTESGLIVKFIDETIKKISIHEVLFEDETLTLRNFLLKIKSVIAETHSIIDITDEEYHQLDEYERSEVYVSAMKKFLEEIQDKIKCTDPLIAKELNIQ